MRKKDLKQIMQWFDQVKEQSVKDSVEYYKQEYSYCRNELFEHDKPYYYSHPQHKYSIGIDNDNKYLTLDINLDSTYTDIDVQSSFNILDKNAKYKFTKLIGKFLHII